MCTLLFSLLQDLYMGIFIYLFKLFWKKCLSSTAASTLQLFSRLFMRSSSHCIQRILWRELSGRPPGRSGGSRAWWWGQRWPPQRGRHTPTQRHASCGIGKPSPSGNSSLNEERGRGRRCQRRWELRGSCRTCVQQASSIETVLLCLHAFL